MTTKLYKNWWLMLFKAFFTVIIGLSIIINPQVVATDWVLLLGVLFGMSGVAMIAGGYSHRRHNYEWTWWPIEGLIDVLICIIIFVQPFESPYFLVFVIGVWIVLMGFLYAATSINIQYYVTSNTIFIVTSVILVLTGLFLLIKPLNGLKVLMLIAGIVTVCYGILLSVISIMLKKVVVEEIDSIKDLY